MKFRINQVLLFVYILLLSGILKQVLYVPLIIAVVAVLLAKFVPDFENLLYLLALLSPFMPVLYIFIFYIPFVIYGYLLDNTRFIKRFLLGYGLSFFSTIILYILSILGIKLSKILIISIFYLPVALVTLRIYYKQKSFRVFRDLYNIESREFVVLLVSIFFLFFVAHNIINSSNLYNSNGTYVYTKFLSVVEGVNKYGQIPQYEPRIAQGEQLFFTDTAVFYSNLAVGNILLKWINPVLFFNAITVFIIWLSILGAWQFLHELLNYNSEKKDYLVYVIPIVGAMSIVLSFMFIQLFESFKQSSTYPINFLILAIIVSMPKKAKHLIIIAALLIISFLIHGTQFIGFSQLAFFSFVILFFWHNPKEQLRNSWIYAKNNKFKLVLIFMLILLVPYFYLAPGQMYKSYMRESLSFKADFSQARLVITEYLYKGLFLDKNTSPLSIKYPDVRRIDERKFGFFFTLFGIASLAFVIFNFRKNIFKKTAAFSLAYLAHFLLSGFLVIFTFIASAEYGYRTVLPFMLVMFVGCIVASICSFSSKTAKIILSLIFFGAFFHSLIYVRQNLENIHSESIIAGQSFKNEIELVKKLSNDGRIITFGMYSNAVDTAMAALTDHYFSRYGFLQWNLEENIYDKLTSLNSFGAIGAIEKMTSNEFANYLRLAGYKYVFSNICHPTGAAAANKLYPSNSYAIYQNNDNHCFVFLLVNNSHYAEKVDLVKEVDEEKYNEVDGYKYLTISRNKNVYNFNIETYTSYFVDEPEITEPLQFNRLSPTEVEIYGNFENNNWVVFKEEHFPRWKAYMNGQEVPLLATNNRMMLIKTLKGNKISLEYSLLPKEKLAGILSLVAVLGLFFAFVFAL